MDGIYLQPLNRKYVVSNTVIKFNDRHTLKHFWMRIKWNYSNNFTVDGGISRVGTWTCMPKNTSQWVWRGSPIVLLQSACCAHLCVVACITEISLIVTLRNQYTYKDMYMCLEVLPSYTEMKSSNRSTTSWRENWRYMIHSYGKITSLPWENLKAKTTIYYQKIDDR